MDDRPHDDDPIWQQAMDHVIAVRAAPDDGAIQAAAEHWRRADTAHEAAFAEAERVWEVAGGIAPQHAGLWLRRAATSVGISPSPSPRRRARIVGLALAGIAVLAAAVALVVAVPNLEHRLRGDEVTGAGDIRTIDLADGSRVTMGPLSVLHVAYDAGSRRVELIDGMAFFDVRPDPARPFLVTGGGLSAQAVGTAYEVRKAGSYRTVSVAEGSVVVSGGGQPSLAETQLTPGDSITVDIVTGSFVREHGQQGDVALWRDRFLVFQRRTVRQAATEIGRWFNGKVVIWDKGLANKPVSGVFDTRDPAAALQALVEPHGGRARQITPWLLVLTGGS